jgi:hypothetical protein
MFTPDEINEMRRDVLMDPDIDGETRSKAMFVAAVMEQSARDHGDEDADQIYVSTCWYLCQAENRAELERSYVEVFDEGMAILSDGPGLPPPIDGAGFPRPVDDGVHRRPSWWRRVVAGAARALARILERFGL